MSGPRRPDDRWVWPAVAAATLVAAIVGVIVYVTSTRNRSFAALGETPREQLAAVDVQPVAIAAVEQEWVADGFEPQYLVAPVGPQPCPAAVDLAPPNEQAALRQAFAIVQGGGDSAEELAVVTDAQPSNLLVALIHATALVRAERFIEAERVITQAFDRTTTDETIIAAARVRGSKVDLDDYGFSTVIHLHHALGYARLQSAADPPWKSLKNVIGSVEQLSRQRLLGGATRGGGAASRLPIAAPGCPPGGDSLSSYDLFNNLIVGYIRARGKYSDTDRNRQREFFREPRTYPRPLRLLLLAQHPREKASDWKNEAELWALSNAERVVDIRHPDDARLAFNIIQLIDWWSAPERCPNDVCTEELRTQLRAERDLLLERALRRRNVTEEQRAVFAAGAVRMLAQSSLDRAKLESDLQQLRGWLPAQKAATLDDLMASGRARMAMAKWLVDPAEDAEEPYGKLGRRAERWREAAVRDFAAAAATWAGARPPTERRQVLVAIRQLLGSGDAPPVVTALEQQFSSTQRLRIRMTGWKAWWALVAFAAALALWLVLMWIIAQVREALSLRESFYNVELEHLRGRPRDPGGR
ncbi:MAG TPA: hypothetical protein VNI54_02965 [Thermoanaerobaculia bacterium]|nr:hypothetical protein [Thermoanaerobaculia bacterium]